MSLDTLAHEIRSGNLNSLRNLAAILIKNESSFPTFIELEISKSIKNTFSPNTTNFILDFYQILFQNIVQNQSLFYLLKSANNDLILLDWNLNDENTVNPLLATLKLISNRVTIDTIIFLYKNDQIPLFTLAFRFLNHSDSILATNAHQIILNLVKLNHTQTTNLVVFGGYFDQLVLNIISITNLDPNNILDIVDSISTLFDLLSLLSPYIISNLSDAFIHTLINPILNLEMNLRLYILILIFSNIQHSALLYNIMLRVFKTSKMKTYSINAFLNQPYLLNIGFLYTVLNSKISQDSLKQINLCPRNFIKSKSLLNDLIGAPKSNVDFISYNEQLVDVLIDNIQNGDSITSKLSGVFMIELVGTGGIHDSPLTNVHMEMVNVIFI